MNNGPLYMWTIYDHPSDYPSDFVARKWVISDGTYNATDACIWASTLEKLRAALDRFHPGLTMLPRSDGDDLNIVETWL